MENIANKTFRANGFAGKTVYDDVFGNRPNYGPPTLSPRVEDYSEIFEGFHSSRGSTIPILDLPSVEDEGRDVFFDVRSSGFDYSEVFGGFDGLDFAVSYDQLFKHSKPEDDSSDDAWTPAQSESLSDESDPSGCSEKNQSLSSGDLHHPYDNTKQFNVSYHKVNTKGKEDISNGVTHVTQLDAIPGYSFIINEASPAKTVEDESSHLHINRNTDIDSGVTNGKKLRKTVSQPPYSDFGLQGHEIDPNPLARDVKSSSPGNAFISVSDISLRTRPSHLPPPSRPPPSFSDRAENSSRLSSKLKASKSYVYEREADYSPPYFDVEIDASSSAAASAAAMKDAVKKAQAQLSSAKELMERKKEGLQNRTKSHLEKDIGHKGEKVSGVDRFNSSKGKRVHRISETEGNEMKDYAAEQRRKLHTTRHISSSSMIGENDAGGAGKYTEHEKEHSQFQVPHETESSVAWREATQFFEVVEEKKVKYENTLVHQSKSNDCGANGKGIGAVVEQKEYHMQTKEATVDHKCQQNGEKFKVLNHGCEQVENKGRSVAGDGSDRQEELRDKSKLAQKAGELKEKKKKTRVTSQLGESDNKLNELDKYVDDDILIEDQLKENGVIYKHKLRGINERVEHVIRIKEAPEKNGSGMERKASFDCNEYERELKENAEQVSDGKKLEEALGQSVVDKLEKEVFETQVNEREGMEAFKVLQHKEKWEEAVEREGRIKRSNEILEQEDSNITLRVDLKQQENKNEQNCACEAEKNEQFSKIALEQSENTERQEKASEKETSDNIPNDDCELDENEKRLKEAWEKKEKWKRSREAHESDESEKRAELLSKAEGSEDRSSEPNVGADCIYSIKEEKNCEVVGAQGSEGRSSEPNVRADCIYSIKEEKNCEGVGAQNSVHEQIKREVIDKKLNFKEGNYSIMEEQKTSDGVHLVGATNTRETYKPSVCEEHESLGMGRKTRERETEAVEEKNEQREKESNSSDMAQNSSRHERIDNEKKDESLCQTATVQKSHEDDIDLGGIQCRNIKGASKIASVTENAYLSTHMHREGRKNLKGVQYAFNQKENRNVFTETQVLNEHERKPVDVLPAQEFTSETPEIEETNCCEKLILEEREKEERLKRERDVENDLLRKIEEEKEREREREKDRMAVDTATREARERAFAETRERAERAAVERATAEVRQRALSEARERLEKASAEARERLLADKSSAEARLKAERAAVERATAEARERAFEKAKTERASSDARERVEKSADKFSAYSRNGGFRQNSLPTDLQSHQSAGCSRDLKYSHSSVSGGLEGESAQRSKARLERYQRTAERAAKALEEKNMRDLLAHKEQAERNRLAEVLDADVKRWSSGKEGNLRALLSTLQYILGPASSWQPIPLTDVITAAAVKKAYRKATLCVHPDKLQQRGASIQQKYICEKVFDLLKEAWNKFNSEER